MAILEGNTTVKEN